MRGGKELIDLKFSLTLQKSTVIMSRVYETVVFERTKDFIYYRYVSTGSTLPALLVLRPSVDSVLVFCTEAGEAG